MNRSPTAMERYISAKLNTGKSPMTIKSLTPQSKILSEKFPNVPAKKRENSNMVRCFLVKR
jgi:hypothetical protein